MKFCSIILQFCRCGGLLNAKGHPDGFLSHFSSLRNFRLGRFFDSLGRLCGCTVSPAFIRTGQQGDGDARQHTEAIENGNDGGVFLPVPVQCAAAPSGPQSRHWTAGPRTGRQGRARRSGRTPSRRRKRSSSGSRPNSHREDELLQGRGGSAPCRTGVPRRYNGTADSARSSPR